jgi:hypothetical protein
MGIVSNNAKVAVKPVGAKAPTDRFLLGSSNCYFEPASGYTGQLTPAKIKNLLLNTVDVNKAKAAIPSIVAANTVLQDCNGKSLKLTLTIQHQDETGTYEEVQHVGFVTHTDFSNASLDATDVEPILEVVRNEAIIQRTNTASVLSMF